MHLSDATEACFPNLCKESYRVTSPADWVYNCIAHAAGKNDSWWWPAPEGTEGVFWPAGVDRSETLAAFIAAFATVGYIPCEGSEYREGFEKIAIFVDVQGTPSHAARQVNDGRWTSKLGELEDIEHQLQELETRPDSDLGYGTAVCFLIRPLLRPVGLAMPEG